MQNNYMYMFNGSIVYTNDKKGEKMKKFINKLAYTLTIVLIFGYGIYTIIEQQTELNNLDKEKDEYLVLLDSEEMKYEQLLSVKENINSDSYIEEVAREKLGLVMPYEIIFVDASL